MSLSAPLRGLLAAAILSFAAPLVAAIQLVPVISSGLTSPVFVGNAGDGSNRLFIVERSGMVKVLQSGASSATVFLDIHTKVTTGGGEQGLLGLAFHPQYSTNGRFFVYYTRAGDGTIVVAEYRVSSGNRDVADATELVLLTIPHPSNTNHNGGMLAFGPDGYLYIGVGDGGSSNDPPNNAQNVNVLLGKILRINVNTPDGTGKLYSSPAGNPFVGGAGADEIFAFGWRNPWRFSFDRTTGNQWVADVGQGAREEVDTPIVAGGNYGWRVYEGFGCTGNDPMLCNPANYLPPIFDYDHTGGRCSITGGYVYRGTQNALPAGTYVYGDFCSGEIFGWDGVAKSLLLDTTQNISSFGEDEQGEVYVVNLGGSVSRIASATPCTYDIAPTAQSYPAAGGNGNATVAAATGCNWTAVANATWLHVTAGATGSGSGSVSYLVDANTTGTPRSGSLTIAGRTLTVTQAAAAACSYSLSSAQASFGGAGGTGSVNVSAGAACPWTARSNVSWVTLTSGTSGSGSGVVAYTVAAYPGPAKNRSGTLTIAGQTFTVKQTKK
ncbi:MAG: PQQ-dependent sugar dehydrogenase [Casimicrobiaceae bacterium]